MDLQGGIDRGEAISTLVDLVRINSINPSLVPGAPGETEIAGYVARWLGAAGLEVAVHERVPGRPSVVGRLRGSGGGRSLMFNAHLDTVGIEGMTNPFSGEQRDGRIYGRGAYDMKGSLAACLIALKALRASPGLTGDVLVAAVADEEDASLGTSEILLDYRPDAAIVTEPTQLQICLAHKGFCWLEVETRGRAAHGSRYDLGIDANLRMGRVLARLEELERRLRASRPHDLVGPPSLHAALLQGGTGASTFAASCRLLIERRTIPGETAAQVVGELEEILKTLEAEDPGFQASLVSRLVREPFETAPSADIVAEVARAAARVLGHPPRFVGDTPWMDAALFAAAGIDTVVFGPSGGGAHADEEWVEVESVMEVARVLCRTAEEYCR